MTRDRVVFTAALLALAAVGAALFPNAVPVGLTVLSVVLIAAAAAAAFARARRLRAQCRSPFDGLVPPDVPVEPPGDLARLERILGWKEYSAEDFDHRVAPVLRRILTSRLAARGVDAVTHPGRAWSLSPPELHRLLDPSTGGDATVDTAQITAMVDALEAL